MWTTSNLDSRIALRLLTSCNRLLVNKLSQAMWMHHDIMSLFSEVIVSRCQPACSISLAFGAVFVTNNLTVRANCLIINITCNVWMSVVIPAFRRVTSISIRLKFAMNPFVCLYVMWVTSLYIFFGKLP